MYGRYNFIDQGLLCFSKSWFGEEFKMLLGLQDFTQAGEIGDSFIEDGYTGLQKRQR